MKQSCALRCVAALEVVIIVCCSFVEGELLACCVEAFRQRHVRTLHIRYPNDNLKSTTSSPFLDE
jgi:hypothetical protein